MSQAIYRQNNNNSTAPEIVNGVFMFPVKDFFYMMNCSVKWDKNTDAFTVKSPLARVFSANSFYRCNTRVRLAIYGKYCIDRNLA